MRRVFDDEKDFDGVLGPAAGLLMTGREEEACRRPDARGVADGPFVVVGIGVGRCGLLLILKLVGFGFLDILEGLGTGRVGEGGGGGILAEGGLLAPNALALGSMKSLIRPDP